jgi:hypothetical protein
MRRPKGMVEFKSHLIDVGFHGQAYLSGTGITPSHGPYVLRLG